MCGGIVWHVTRMLKYIMFKLNQEQRGIKSWANTWRWYSDINIMFTRRLFLLVIPLNQSCFQWEATGHFPLCSAEITLLQKLLYVGLWRQETANDAYFVSFMKLLWMITWSLLCCRHGVVWSQKHHLSYRETIFDYELAECNSLCTNLHNEL